MKKKFGIFFRYASLLFLVGALTSLFFPSAKDAKRYERILAKKIALTSQKKLSEQEATHNRQNVQKDIWFASTDNTRLHMRLVSDDSQVTLSNKKGKISLIEKLHGIDCILQDKIFCDEKGEFYQQLRHFQAATGTYYFPQNLFSTQNLFLSIFTLAGEEIPQAVNISDAFLSGEAKEAHFHLSQEEPFFQAQHVKARVNPQGHL